MSTCRTTNHEQTLVIVHVGVDALMIMTAIVSIVVLVVRADPIVCVSMVVLLGYLVLVLRYCC